MEDMPQEELLRRVLDNYDIGALRRVARHGGTAGRNWKVETTCGTWLLRTRGTRTSSDEAVALDHSLRRHLVSRGVPTAAPVVRRDGLTFTRLGERAYEVYPFVPGLACKSASDAQLQSAGRGLAAFHRAASDFPLIRATAPVAQYASLDIPEASARPEDPALLAQAYERLAADAQSGPSAEAAKCCRLWVARLRTEFGLARYDALPHVLTHGDYTLANLLFDEHGGLAGIFDLDWARWAPRIRDLADGMFFIGAVRRTPLAPADIWSLTETADLSIERCVLWLRAYAEPDPLGHEELGTLPLAFAARWLSVRAEGTAKVSPEERARFCFRDIVAPLDWLEGHWSEVETAMRNAAS